MKDNRSHRVRPLVVLCLAALCWGFSFGLEAPVASYWMQDAGCSQKVIGGCASMHYLGIALAAWMVAAVLRFRARATLVAGLIVSAFSVVLFPWGGNIFGWYVLRGLSGVTGAFCLVPIESLVNHNAAPQQRARDFGFYALAIAVGIGLGELVGIQMYPLAPVGSFLTGGGVGLLGAVVVQLGLPPMTIPKELRHGRTPLDFRRNFLSFGSSWSQGFLEGGMIALVPIYLGAIGLTNDQVSWVVSGTMLGVILIQVPIAWLADRLGRSRVLLCCQAFVVLGLAMLPLYRGVAGLGCWLFLCGAGSTAFYPLGLALLGERLAAPALPRANGWYLAINCAGSVIGPSLAGWAMDLFGKEAFFYTGEAAVLLVLVVWAVLRWSPGGEPAGLSRRESRQDKPAGSLGAPTERQAA
jgi:MFS family permease